MDRISREIAYVSLGGGIRSKRSPCMQLLLLFFLNEYKICLPGGRRILTHVFKGPRIFGLQPMFSEDQRFWILAHVFKDLGFLDLGSCFQRTKGFLGFGSCFQRTKSSGSQFMFSETQDFGALAHADVCGLSHQYLQNKHFQLVTELFIEKNSTYLANAPSLGHTPCFKECWGWIVDLILHHWRMWKRIIAFCS